MTPDPSFVKDLQAYDGALRVRWARHTETWMIERKLQIRNPAWLAERPLNPFGVGKRKKDLWEGWRAGYVHVLSVHPSLLNWRTVAPVLVSTDREQAGSWQALNDQIDAADAKMDAERERTLVNWSESAAKDAADHLFVLEGHTVFTPPSQSGVEPSDTVEAHEGFTVRVKKGAHS